MSSVVSVVLNRCMQVLTNPVKDADTRRQKVAVWKVVAEKWNRKFHPASPVNTESGASSDSRFCHKFSSEFHCLVGHTTAVGQPCMEENYKSNFQRKINKTYYPS